MIVEKSWSEFQSCGLLWLINQTLHVFGWAIVFETSEETAEVWRVYPARVDFRGFPAQVSDAGVQAVTKYLAENIQDLKREVDS
jgi:hypothetical protein